MKHALATLSIFSGGLRGYPLKKIQPPGRTLARNRNPLSDYSVPVRNHLREHWVGGFKVQVQHFQELEIVAYGQKLQTP
jgi:hypothetical protein